MDSLTQITLGAAVGEAVLGRQIGNRAIVWGAVFGTLPDLDVLLTPFQDSVQFLVHHRGLSHSLSAVVVTTPLLSWGFARWYRHSPGYWRWFSFFFLVLLTHILLDCCTVYGTQLFLPFSDWRIAWSSIFIIDPLYTIPFLACVTACLFLRRTSRWRRAINCAGLVLSSGYLALTIVNKSHVERVFAGALARQQVDARRFMSCPTPLNNVLWYGIAEDEQGYHVGLYSLLDSDEEIEFQRIPRRADLLGELIHSYAVDRLIWFADGYYNVRPHTQGVLLHVMKFGNLDPTGRQERYPFTYLIRQTSNPGVVVEPFESTRDVQIGELAARLWTRLKGN